MSRIILITGYFDIYGRDGLPTGKREFLVSHGINEGTLENVIVENVPPKSIEGAYFDSDLHEWCVGD